MAGERLGVRTPFKSRIRLMHRSLGSIDTETTDISDGGVYLVLDQCARPDIGELVRVQVLDLPYGEAPILDLQVVRCDEMGVGLKSL